MNIFVSPPFSKRVGYDLTPFQDVNQTGDIDFAEVSQPVLDNLS